MEFLGRESELAALQRRLQNAAQGEGAIVLVKGELGIGKSRLVQRAAELAADQGFAVAKGRWYESPHVPAYVGFLECFSNLLKLRASSLRRSLDADNPHIRELARLGPEFAAALDLTTRTSADVQDQYGLWRGVVLLLEAACAANGPVVLVIDDFQWADQASFNLLTFIGRNISDLPLLILATYRGEVIGPEDPVGETLSDPQSVRLEEIVLSGLDWESIRAIAERAVGAPIATATAKELCDFTNGNPLFTEEIGRRLSAKQDANLMLFPGQVEEHLRKGLPNSVREVMLQRFSALSAECQYLLELAACVGRNFDLFLIEEIADLESPELTAIFQEATSSAVVVEVSPGLLAFSHPLMREVSYAAIPPANRMAIHKRVATALEKSYGATSARHAREIANHLISAGGLADSGLTLYYCTMGAQQARSLFAADEMCQMAQAGIAALERMPIEAPRLRAKLLMDEAYADTMIGHPTEALATYRQALSVYQALGDGEGKVDCDRWIATTLLRYGRWQEALDVTEAALQRAPEARTDAFIALTGAHALAALVAGRHEEVATWSEKLLDLCFDDETKALAHHVAAGHHSWGTGDPAAAMSHFQLCREYFLRIGNDGTAAQVAADHAVAAYLLGHVQQSREAQEASSLLAERTTRVTVIAELYAYSTVVDTHEGRWEEARAAAARGKAMIGQMGGSTIYGQLAQRALALQQIWQGGPTLDEDALSDTRPLRNEPLQAYLLAEQGETKRAGDVVSAIGKDVPADGRGLFWLSIALPLVAAKVTLRDNDVVRWLDGLGHYKGGLFDWFSVDLELGRAYTLLEDWEHAEECFRRAITQHDRDGLRCFLALAQYRYGVMLLERREPGDRKRGLSIVESAVDAFSELGMDYMRGKAELLLPKPRSGRRDGVNPAHLTSREWETLELLAGGRTNREISESLIVSRRTVEYHLQNIYGKVGVQSRAAAIAWFAKQNASEAPPPPS